MVLVPAPLALDLDAIGRDSKERAVPMRAGEIVVNESDHGSSSLPSKAS